MEKTYKKTNIYLIDDELWKWAKYRADTMGFNSVSEYVFELFKQDKVDPKYLEEGSMGPETV